ncbi:restriction endonuclease subunit S [Caproiciproducens faecalis]|uniref:Restriction endonuclease subunit S n=1 Tax=Caproiciproducens faecalis TaxID=2820301 RepID=A0ABS7DIY2_9FIRM|nr:restriction endonuclease subunit S [Caproiciproducens faecalis]MBW7571249.1 restriction endonuclease subunit S [Caproiciproducens faecalis]
MVKEGYKQTEAGFIPEDWDTITFRECFDVLPNNTLSRAELNYNSGKIKNIHYGDVLIKFPEILDCERETLPFVNPECVSKLSTAVLQDGDIIIADTAEDNTVGKATEVIGIGEQRIVSGLHTIPCRPKQKDRFALKWLGYYVNHRVYHDQLLPFVTGIKVSSISKGAIADTVIAIPKKDEQKHIVEVLSDMDNLIISLEELIVKKKAIMEGAMQELLTGQCRLPGFEGEWKNFALSDVATIVMGQSPDSKYYNEVQGTPLVQGNADIENRKTIIRFYTTCVTKQAYKGDIIFTVRAPVGNVAHATFDCCLGRGVCAFRNASQFLYHLLVYKQESWSELSTGSTFDSINSDNLSKVEFNMPIDEGERDAIAEVLTSMDSEIESLQLKLEKYKKMKSGMMDELLTGKVRLV